jgi:hypothetical protein
MHSDDGSRASNERFPMLCTTSEISTRQERWSSNLPHTGDPRDPDARDVLCKRKTGCEESTSKNVLSSKMSNDAHSKSSNLLTGSPCWPQSW